MLVEPLCCVDGLGSPGGSVAFRGRARHDGNMAIWQYGDVMKESCARKEGKLRAVAFVLDLARPRADKPYRGSAGTVLYYFRVHSNILCTSISIDQLVLHPDIKTEWLRTYLFFR